MTIANQYDMQLDAKPLQIVQGGRVRLTATTGRPEARLIEAIWKFPGRGPKLVQTFEDDVERAHAIWEVPDDLKSGSYDVRVTLRSLPGPRDPVGSEPVVAHPPTEPPRTRRSWNGTGSRSS